jgi:CHAT domain-containing protein/tetratricopeptide (TPR) repeat protein
VIQKRAACLLTGLLLAGGLTGQEGTWTLLTQRVNELTAQGRTTEALPVAERALRIAESTFGPLDRRLAASLNNLADLYRDRGRLAEAEGLFRHALEIDEAALGDSDSTAAALNNLAMLYKDEGKLRDAEPLLKRALAIYKNTLGQTHPYTVTAMNNLGDLYRAEGRNASAESFYRGAAFLAEKSLELNLPPPTLKYAHSLRSMIRHNLGELYRSQGKYAEAEGMYKAALQIRETELGENHPDTASTLNALAMLYDAQGRYADAERLCRRSLEIRKRVLGDNHRSVAYSLSTLAWNLRMQQKYADAEQAYKRAIEIEENTLGKEDPLLVTPLDGLAETYQDELKYDEAERLYRRTLAIRKQERRLDDAGVGLSLFHLAVLDYARGNSAAGEALFEESFTHLHNEFDYQFSYLGEADRLAFLDLVGDAFPLYFSFCYTYRNQNPALVGNLYNTVLWQKGVVADSIAGLRARAAAGGNQQAHAELQQLTELRTRIAAMQNPPPGPLEDWNQTLLRLQDEANSLERSLVKRDAGEPHAQASWQQVRAALGKAEAAVEFVRFGFWSPADSTDRVCYVALILTAGADTAAGGPEIIYLGESKELEGRAMADYRMRVAPPVAGPGIRGVKLPPRAPVGTDAGLTFYRAFWKPLEARLRGVKRVFVAPDGVLNLVSWAAVPMEGGGLLMDKYDIDVVLSTRDLLRSPVVSGARNAVLIGNPKFDLREPEYRAAVAALPAGRRTSPTCMAPAGMDTSRPATEPGRSQTAVRTLEPLPGSQAEIDAICGLLAEKGWKVDSYGGAAALEETVKRVRSPRVLHLATHGFFEPEQESFGRAGLRSAAEPQNPMLRSGLYFAGAGSTLAGHPPGEDMEDGVLTAYEAAGLSLEGTELVVLSACETGLGVVRNGEGVFGLRRALQEAGVGAILMSMWPVPDEETKQLMTQFYRNWLSGNEKHTALHKAQMELRNRLMQATGADRPDLWAGFVLAGR